MRNDRGMGRSGGLGVDDAVHPGVEGVHAGVDSGRAVGASTAP